MHMVQNLSSMMGPMVLGSLSVRYPPATPSSLPQWRPRLSMSLQNSKGFLGQMFFKHSEYVIC